jgi:hypothetical protein
MTANNPPVASRSLPGFPVWMGGVIAAYVAVSVVAFRRTLIPDEVRPLILSMGPLRDLLTYVREDIIHTPVSFVSIYAWQNVFGNTDVAAKMFALVVGACILAAFGVLARRVTPQWRLATLLMGGLMMRVGSSPNLVRMYGLLLLFIVAALFAWVEWRRLRNWQWLAGWVFAITLAIYSHPSALLVLGAMVVATWVVGPKRLAFTGAALLPPIALLPWLAVVYPGYREQGLIGFGWMDDASPLTEVLKLPRYFLTGDVPGGRSPVGFFTAQVPREVSLAALLLFAVLIAVAFGSAMKLWRDAARREERDHLTAGVLLILLPIAVLFLVSTGGSNKVTPRYLVATWPVVALMIAWLAALSGRAGQVVASLMVVWILASDVIAARLQLATTPPRSAADYLDQHLAAEDVVVGGSHIPHGWQLYWEWKARLRRPEAIYLLEMEMPKRTRSIAPATPLDAMGLERASRVWFLAERRNVNAAFAADLAARGFVPADSMAMRDGSLQLFVRTPAAGQR